MCLGDSACVLTAEGLLQRKDNKKGRVGFVVKAKEWGSGSCFSLCFCRISLLCYF